MDTEYEASTSKIKTGKRKEVEQSVKQDTKRSLDSCSTDKDIPLHVEKKDYMDKNKENMNQMTNLSQNSFKRHIKIEGISSHGSENNPITSRRHEMSRDMDERYVLKPRNEQSQSEFTLRASDRASRNLSNRLSVNKVELSGGKKQKINLMREESVQECASVSKEIEDDNGPSEWSKCWVEIKEQKKEEIVESGGGSEAGQLEVDKYHLTAPMMTMDLKNMDKHSSNNLSNILSMQTMTCNLDPKEEKEMKIKKAERLQKKIVKTIRKNQTMSTNKSSQKDKTRQSENEASAEKGLSSLEKLESFAANSSQAIQDLIDSSKKILELSTKKIGEKPPKEGTELHSTKQNQGLVVNYHSTIGHDSQEYCFQKVQDILTLHHESSMNTNCEQKIKLIKQIQFHPNDLNFK